MYDGPVAVSGFDRIEQSTQCRAIDSLILGAANDVIMGCIGTQAPNRGIVAEDTLNPIIGDRRADAQLEGNCTASP